jgi:hypothetical protein
MWEINVQRPPSAVGALKRYETHSGKYLKSK